MDKAIKILYVEDVPNDAILVLREISRNGIQFTHTVVETKNDFVEALISLVPDIIISDYHLPMFDGMQALSLRNEIAPKTPFILVTGAVNEEVAVECMKAGADDYILKSNLTRLGSAIQAAITKRDSILFSLDSESKLRYKGDYLKTATPPYVDKKNSLKTPEVDSPDYETTKKEVSPRDLLLNTAGIGTWVFRLAEKKGFFDDKACQLLGFKPMQIKKTEIEFLKCVHKLDRNEVKNNLLDAVKNKTDFESNFRVVWPDGAIKFLTIRAKTILNEEESPIRLDGLVWDTTDQKLLQITLQENLRKTNSIINNLNGIVFRCKIDDEMTMEYISDGVMELTGYPTSDFLMNRVRSFASLIFAADKENVLNAIQESVKKKKPFTVEYRIESAQGTIKWLWEKGRGVFLDNKTIALEGYISDITDRKNAEVDLKMSLEELRELTQYIEKVREDERVAISRELHDDLGQALTAVKIDLSTIKQLVSEKEALVRINKVTALVSETIKTVQKLTSQLRPQIIDDLGLEAAIEWYTNEFSERNKVEVLLHIETGINISPEASLIIFRIMQESLTNIARHSKATQVELNLHKKGETINFSIADNGIGITENEIKSRKAFGILSMKERAVSLGGTLEIFRQNNYGTTVNLSFPLNNE